MTMASSVFVAEFSDDVVTRMTECQGVRDIKRGGL